MGSINPGGSGQVLRQELAAALARLDAMPHIETVTQAEYDALPAPDANTLYVIVEG